MEPAFDGQGDAPSPKSTEASSSQEMISSQSTSSSSGSTCVKPVHQEYQESRRVERLAQPISGSKCVEQAKEECQEARQVGGLAQPVSRSKCVEQEQEECPEAQQVGGLAQPVSSSEAETIPGHAVFRPSLFWRESAGGILKLIRSGQLPSYAAKLQDHIGDPEEKWPGLDSKTALSFFMGRYTNLPTATGQCQWQYECIESNGWYMSTLVIPAFFGRRFNSSWTRTMQWAEEDARQVFKADLQVLEILRKLPPPMQKIRDRASLDKDQKKVIREMGYNTTTVQSQIWTSVYSGFKQLGCRTAAWDAEVSQERRARPHAKDRVT